MATTYGYSLYIRDGGSKNEYCIGMCGYRKHYADDIAAAIKAFEDTPLPGDTFRHKDWQLSEFDSVFSKILYFVGADPLRPHLWIMSYDGGLCHVSRGDIELCRFDEHTGKYESGGVQNIYKTNTLDKNKKV